MSMTAGRLKTKTISTLLLVYLLFFILGVVPEHLATHASHDGCEICAIIHHPPDLQSVDLASFHPNLREDDLPHITAPPALLDLTFEADPSRAPPSHA